MIAMIKCHHYIHGQPDGRMMKDIRLHVYNKLHIQRW